MTNSLSRVDKTINFDGPDRYPIMYDIRPGAWTNKRYL